MNVRANWDSIHSSTAYFQTTGVNDGETPAKSIFARFDSQRDTSTKASPVTAAPIQPEKVSIQEEQNTLEAEPKEQKADASPVRDEDIKELVEKYVKMGMEAIRLKDFSYIEPLLDPKGKIYEESQESIRSIHRKGLTEEVLMVQVQHISENSPTEFIVDTYEEYKITYPDGTDMLKGFNSTYRVRALDNHSLVMNETITVDEVFAEEVQVLSGRLPAEVIKGSCISCHGGSLEGGAGPGLIGLSGRMSEEEIIAILENGKGIMPGGLVSPDEAESLAAFLMGLDE
ncbi:cytochrome c [Rossellomorea sp. AcN35-11]|nr:cytochrome c [Rossellomorea sp. AcN35-11]